MSGQTTAKELVLLHGEIKTPPLSQAARRESGRLLRQVQNGIALTMPHSRPMPGIGPRCHELRINDEKQTWRVIYRIDENFIVVAHIFSKKTQQTPQTVIDSCKKRYQEYDRRT
ncbi:MAG: type II toxin-antitoxin system RelE/ParE family toxin [Abitibacteriaceae bacterium]|nr:type II toxin-antitoxin system RelE/ParE family toxin [Abditibacteriaceae bacterium]